MHDENTTTLVDTWSHYFATLGMAELFMVVMAFLLAVATSCFISVLWRSLPIDDRHQSGASSGLGGSESIECDYPSDPPSDRT